MFYSRHRRKIDGNKAATKGDEEGDVNDVRDDSLGKSSVEHK